MALLRAGIIGAGHIAKKAHIAAFQSYKEPIEVVAICGRNEERTKATAEQFHIPNVYTNLDEMLYECKPNIVSVCTPNNLHCSQVLKALEAQCHVLCEKPPALAYADAKKMADKAKEVNRLLGYHLHFRKSTGIETIKKYIDDGSFGTVYHIKATFLRRRGIPGWGSFTNKEIQGGGALMDIGIHVLDLALFLLDFPEVTTVLGSTYDYIGKKGGVGLMGQWDPASFTVEDACFAHISLKNGCSISLEVSFALNAEAEKNFNLNIYGSRMGASLVPLKLFGEKDMELFDLDLSHLPDTDTHQKNIHCFIDRCLGQDTSVCTAEEGVALQKIIEGIYTSANEGHAVQF